MQPQRLDTLSPPAETTQRHCRQPHKGTQEPKKKSATLHPNADPRVVPHSSSESDSSLLSSYPAVGVVAALIDSFACGEPA